MWLAYVLAPPNQQFSRASWTILIKQPHDERAEPFLWSHIKRDCHLSFDDRAVDFSDQQFKLIRRVHCYFMPFYFENLRRSHLTVYYWEKEAEWCFEVPAPSQHERLEAALKLREWLKSKFPFSEVDSLVEM